MKKPKKPSLKRLKRVKIPQTPPLPARLKRAKSPEQKVTEAIRNAPRITNETVSEHREEVLAGARKYIYPLQHSKHRVVRISVALLLAVIVAFFVATGLALYKFQSTGGFIYDVTRIVPFPVAKAGGDWISYESYLFELRRNMHYYRTQQQANFKTTDGRDQLRRLKRQAMDQVIQNAYVSQLADQHDVSVSGQAVDNQVALVRNQNRLGSSDRAFRDVLSEFWGWSESDFKRELKQQLLQQAVVAKLDTQTASRARAALTQLRGGADFAAVAGQVSDDPATKGTGGQYPAPVTYGDRNLSPLVTAELFRLSANQLSGIVNTGYTLEILKVTEVSGNNRRAAHIQFNLQPITTYTKPLQTKEPSRQFIKF